LECSKEAKRAWKTIAETIIAISCESLISIKLTEKNIHSSFLGRFHSSKLTLENNHNASLESSIAAIDFKPS
jgi:hypothetical protein